MDRTRVQGRETDVRAPMGRPRPGSRVRSGGLAAASALVLAAAAALAFAAPVQAQTAITLVSNTGQTGGSRGIHFPASRDLAQGFTAGTNARFSSVQLENDEVTTGLIDSLTVTLNSEASGGGPGSVLATLTKPASVVFGVNTFTDPGSTELTSGETYFIVVTYSPSSGGPSIVTRTVDAEDAGGVAGWTIGDTRHQRDKGTSSWSTSTDDQSFVMSVTGTITPTVSITAGAAVTEGAAATFTVTASPAPSSALTVSLTVSETGSFVAAGDLGSKTVTVPTTGSATYTVPTVDDAADEANGSVEVEVGTGTGYDVHATNSSASVTVNDNDDAPPPSTTDTTLVSNTGRTTNTSAGLNDYLQAQSFAAGTDATLSSVELSATTLPGLPDSLTVTLNSASGGEPDSVLATLTNPMSISNGLNTFTDPANTALTSGETYFIVLRYGPTSSGPAFATTASNREEDTGVAGWTIGNRRHQLEKGTSTWDTPGNALLVQINGTIVTDDDQPVVSITAGAAVTEGADASFTVTASPAPSSALTVSLTVSETGSFVAAGDLGSKTVTVPTTGSATYTVPTVDDAADEANGAVEVEVGTGTGYDVHATNSSASVTVNDNDDAPTPTETTLVSNTGRSGTTNLAIGQSGGNKWSMAIGFTTGDNADGYTLSSVEAVGQLANANHEAQVSIYTAGTSDSPGSSLYVLTTPSDISTAEKRLTFTAPADATIEKETTYFVVFEAPVGSASFEVTSSPDEDPGKASNWSISDKRFNRPSDAGSWSESSNSQVPKIAVNGTIVTPTPITITTEHDSYGGGLEDVVFKLTREGATTEALDATVEITQEQNWLTDLSHDVTFAAGLDTTSLTLGLRDFSLDPTTSGDLIAAVGANADTVEIISISHAPITISFDKPAYSFAEETASADVAIDIVAILDPAYPRAPPRPVYYSYSTRSGQADAPEDYASVGEQPSLAQSDFGRQSASIWYDALSSDSAWVASVRLQSDGSPGIDLVDDDVYEGDEVFNLILEFSPGNTHGTLVRFVNPDSTFSGISATGRYPVTITDEADLPVLALAVDPATIAEEDDTTTAAVDERVSTVTASITNGKTFADDQTLTLTFGGTATAGTHYAVSPADADAVAEGHQIALAGDSVVADSVVAGASSVSVTVTATSNDTAGGDRTVTVTGSRDGTAFGATQTITIDDDETTPGTATGAPAITGTRQVGQELTVSTDSIADADGKTKAESGDAGYAYTYVWKRVSGGTETTIAGQTAGTYTPVADDVGHSLKVEVSFTDDADNPEGPLTSAELGPVLAAREDCADRTDNDWCTRLVVGEAPGSISYSGFRPGSYGALDDRTISDGTTTYRVIRLHIGVPSVDDDFVEIQFDDPPGPVPHGSVFNLGGTEFTTDADAESGSRSYRWDRPAGFAWIDGQEVTVSMKLPVAVPGPATGAPAIIGTRQVGQELTVSTDSIADGDGKTKAESGDAGYAYTYVWKRVSGGTETTIAGETTSTYTPVADDVGHSLKVEVSFTDDADNAEGPLASAELGPVLAAREDCADRTDNDWCTRLVVGERATGPATNYGFRDSGYGELDDPAIVDGATTYTVDLLELVDHMVGDDLVTIRFVNPPGRVPHGSVFNFGGTEFTADAAAESGSLAYRWDRPAGFTWIVGQEVTVSMKLPVAVPGPATGAPAITGTRQVGQELTVSTDGIADADGKTKAESGDAGYAYTYVWKRVSGGTETTIAGETTSTYTPVADDVGNSLKVEVSFTDDADNPEGPLTSAELGPVLAAREDCADRTDNDWCTRLVVGVLATPTFTYFGFDDLNHGELDDPKIVDDTTNYTVETLELRDNPEGSFPDKVAIEFADPPGRVPHGSVFNFGGTEFTADAGRRSPDPELRLGTPRRFHLDRRPGGHGEHEAPGGQRAAGLRRGRDGDAQSGGGHRGQRQANA